MKLFTLRVNYKSIVYGVLGICLIQGIVSDYIGFRQINYLCDVLLLLMFGVRMCKNRLLIFNWQRNIECVAIVTFAGVVLIGWLFNSTPLPSALWGVRNYGRFFLFYILMLAVGNHTDVIKMEKIFLKLFPIHMIFVAFQYVVEGLSQDNLSGLFGKATGSNGGLLIYLAIIFCIILCQLEYKMISLPKFLIWTLLILINAALSELKFFFILVILLMVWYFLVAKRKGRSMITSLFLVIALYIGVQVFYHVFPDWANYLSVDNIMIMISDQETYASQTDIGRTAVFSKLSPIITKWAGKDALLWGIGLGNGDYSDAFRVLNSAFYKVYGITHYTWLSLGYLFVETGYLGTLAYISFFIILEIKAIMEYGKMGTYYNLLNIFFPIVFLIILIYNSSMRSNFAYMAFAVLTWQTLIKKKGQKEQAKSNDG